ncbi:MAG: methyltransferase [Planctomycetes bacterium SM23_32]|nr:MAG: methyltransferase [Planctomycetes bacterium SM23_32]
MTGRERICTALSHREPDMVPMDFGATAVSGIAASVVYALRQVLKLDPPGEPVKVVEPYQMLGEVAADLRAALGIDAVGVPAERTLFGFENTDWKPWRLFDGTPVVVPGAFNTEPEADGSILMYPEGDRSAPPSGRMPAGGYYFDTIVRQPPIVEDELRVEDNVEEFTPVSAEELGRLESHARRLRNETELAVVGSFANAGFGDIALVPAPFLKDPRGIRDVEEWYVSTVTRRDFVREVFARQCDIAIANLERIHAVAGEHVDVLFVSGTDFGTQRGPFLSTEAYCDLYKPFHRRVNEWAHANTPWRTFIHSCGGVEPLIEHFIEAGFDILNPVQCSAEGMEPGHLKAAYGERITFWGGGVDTQKTLPFGTPEEVREEVKRRVQTFAEGGGYVFNAIHNVQANTPIENVMAMLEGFAECR